MTSADEQREADHVKDWIETFTGRRVRLTAPSIADINIIDVAHALSMQCRYTGHTRFFYPVGHHCILIYDWLRSRGHPPSTCLRGLLHDSGETWAADVARPLKPMVPELVAAERRMTALTYRLVGLADDDEEEALVHDVDHRIIGDERRATMSDSGNVWGTDRLEPLGVDIRPSNPEEIKRGFLARYASAAHAHLGRPVYMAPFWGHACSWTDSPKARVSDVVECDALGGVALVLERDDRGMYVRDLRADFPRPLMRWVHGSFSLVERRDG